MVRNLHLVGSVNSSGNDYESSYDDDSSTLYDSNSSLSGYDSQTSSISLPSEKKRMGRRRRSKYVVNPNYEKEWFAYCDRYYRSIPAPVPIHTKSPKHQETLEGMKKPTKKNISKQSKQAKKHGKHVKQQKESHKKKNRKKNNSPNSNKEQKSEQATEAKTVKTAENDISAFSRLSRAIKGIFSLSNDKYQIIDGVKVFNREDTLEFVSEMKSLHGQRAISVLSWNILAQRYIESDRGKKLYNKCNKKALQSTHRLSNLTRILNETRCDVCCLQEVDRNTFDYCLTPFFSALGYKGVLHCSTLKDKSEIPGLATFFNSQVFEISKFIKSYRVLLVELTMFNSTKILIANCHLEANPIKKKERSNQLKAGLRKMSKFNSNFVVLSGDFNSRLSKDNLLKQLETFGLQNADSVVKQTTCQNARIDHTFVRNMRTLGICRVNEPNSDKLPSILWPSDHFLIASVLKLLPIDMEETKTGQQPKSIAALRNYLIENIGKENFKTLEGIIKDENVLKADLKKSGRKLNKEEIQEQREKSKSKKAFISAFDESTQSQIKEYIKKKKIKL